MQAKLQKREIDGKPVIVLTLEMMRLDARI